MSRLIEPIELNETSPDFKEAVLEKIPAANFDLCLTCGTCTAGCPASELLDMDPRKLIRMLVLGLDEELTKTDWAWVCTMCARCTNACPMSLDVNGMVQKGRMEDSECVLCGSCVDTCPKDVIRYSFSAGG